MSRNATRTHATSAIFVLYVAFLASALGLGLLGTDSITPRLLDLGVALVFLCLMIGYWVGARVATGLQKPKPRVIGVLRPGRAATVILSGPGYGQANRVTSNIAGTQESAPRRISRDALEVSIRLSAATSQSGMLTAYAGERSLGEAPFIAVSEGAA